MAQCWSFPFDKDGFFHHSLKTQDERCDISHYCCHNTILIQFNLNQIESINKSTIKPTKYRSPVQYSLFISHVKVLLFKKSVDLKVLLMTFQ